MSPSFFSGNIAYMIPEGPLNKMVPLTEDHGGGGGCGGGGGGGGGVGGGVGGGGWGGGVGGVHGDPR